VGSCSEGDEALPHFWFLTGRNMLSKWRTLKYFILLAGILMVFSSACARKDKYIGTYQAVPGTPTEFADLTLVLKKNGEGVRSFQGTDISFQWVSRGRIIRIHTKSGGTIIAHARDDRLLLRLPGPLYITLKKIQ
jgi:hypothetical protein